MALSPDEIIDILDRLPETTGNSSAYKRSAIPVRRSRPSQYRQPDEKDDGNFFQRNFSWAVDNPVMRTLSPVFDALQWVDETWASIATAPFSPHIEGANEGKGFWDELWWNVSGEREREEYRKWDSPKGVKGFVEMVNPIYFASAAAPFKAASLVAKGLGTTSKVGRAAGAFSTAGKALETTAKGVSYAEALPGRALGKALKKSWEVLPTTERKLLRRVPQMTDDFIKEGEAAGRVFTAEEKTAVRQAFEEQISKGIDNVVVSDNVEITKLRNELSELQTSIQARRFKPDVSPDVKPLYENVIKELPDEIKDRINIKSIKEAKFSSSYAGEGGRVVVGGSLSKPEYHILLEKGNWDIETLKHELIHSYVLENPTHPFAKATVEGKSYFGMERAVTDIMKQLKEGKFVHEQFISKGEERLLKQIASLEALGKPMAADIANRIAKELDIIEPTRKLTGLTKVKELIGLSKQNRASFVKGIRAERLKRQGAGEDIYQRLKAEGVPHEEAYAKAAAQETGSIIDAVKGMGLNPEQLARLQITDKEMADIVNQIVNTKYRLKKGTVSATSHHQANEALKAFNQLVLEQKPLANYQLKLLAQSLGEETVGSLYRLAKEGTLYKILDLANMPRALLASFDMSAPFRQGAILQARMISKGQFGDLADAYKQMFKAFATEKHAVNIDDLIRSGKRFEDRMAHAGYHAPIMNKTFTTGEEQFFSEFGSKWIPGVRRSERSFNTFMNTLRDKQYNNTIDMWERWAAKEGSSVTTEMIEEAKTSLNRLINAASGRGHLPQVLEGNLGALLNATLFSPRLLISRLQFPFIMMDKRVPELVRREAAKETLAFLGFGASILTMASLAGAKIVGDPRSSDFGKIKFGNTRIDVWAGYLQFFRLAAQLASGERKTALGEIEPLTRYEALERFIQSKTSPATGLVVDLLKGESYMGDDMSLKSEDLTKQAKNRLVPLFLQGLMDAMEDQGPMGGLLSVPEFFGAGTQTYNNMSVDARNELSRQFGLTSDIWAKDEIKEAAKTLEPYYQIEETVWGQVPELEAIAEQIRVLERTRPQVAEQILMQYPQILEIRAYIAQAKKQMLAQHPEIREALTLVNR